MGTEGWDGRSRNRMKKILIVEDQPEIRKLLRMTLGRPDRSISEAADGASGWRAALELQPDIVLLDIMMPGDPDGLQLCQRIKSDPLTGHAKVILVSARGHRNDMVIGRQAGADDYLLKPFSPLRLVEVVEALSAPV
jgi:DNA-binding response OmpR family regulator